MPFDPAISLIISLVEPRTSAHTIVSAVQTPSAVTSYGTISRDVGLQALENKVLSWGIIGISAPILAEIHDTEKSAFFCLSAEQMR
jgi:hypothetical protein